MKIRLGFVSNSSSSSFVICGFKIKSESIPNIYKKIFNLSDDEIIAELKENDSEIDENSINDFCNDEIYDVNFEDNGVDFINNDGEKYIGMLLAEGDDCGNIDNKTVTISKINHFLLDISKKLSFNIKDAKIFCGTKQQ